MRSRFILIFLLVYSQNLFAQQSFENDKQYKPFLLSSYNEIISEFNLNTNVDFEYRLWVWHSLEWRFTLFIVTENNGRWTIRGFENSQESRSRHKEIKAVDTNISALVKKLEENNYLSIPDSKLLKDSTGKRAEFAIADGLFYTFELISRNSKRSYFYKCPSDYEKEYPYIKEYKQIATIIKAIFKYFAIGDDYICTTTSNYLINSNDRKEIYSK